MRIFSFLINGEEKTTWNLSVFYPHVLHLFWLMVTVCQQTLSSVRISCFREGSVNTIQMSSNQLLSLNNVAQTIWFAGIRHMFTYDAKAALLSVFI